MGLLRILIILLLIPSLSWAACSGSSPTWTAADCSNTEISTCIAGATSGDTINVPAEPCAWTAAVRLYLSSGSTPALHFDDIRIYTGDISW